MIRNYRTLKLALDIEIPPQILEVDEQVAGRLLSHLDSLSLMFLRAVNLTVPSQLIQPDPRYHCYVHGEA
jgi:hypothetical protein